MKNLTAMRVVWLNECKGLDVLPEWLGQLICLEEFNIINCPNLTSLPESIRNLTALKEQYIWGCPTLVDRCQGEDADMVSHIPEVILHRGEEEEMVSTSKDGGEEKELGLNSEDAGEEEVGSTSEDAGKEEES